MSQFKIFKETSLPARLENNQIYLVSTSKPEFFEMYVTQQTGQARRILNENDIRTILNEYQQSSAKLSIVQRNISTYHHEIQFYKSIYY